MSPILGIYASQISGKLSSYDSIASFTISGSSTGSVTFNSIPQNYTHLQLRVFARSLTSASTEALYLYNFNNDSGSTGSSSHVLYCDGSSVGAVGYTGQYSSLIGNIPAASSTSNVFGTAVVDILDYTNTNKNKTIRVLNGYDANGSGRIEYLSNLPLTLPGTGAITTLTPSLTGGSYLAAGTTISLYGIKG